MSLLTSTQQRGLLADYMNLVTKNDLKFNDRYSWKASGGDNPAYRGRPDSDLLHKTEGYEILDLLNSLAREQPGWTKRDSLIAEAKIQYSNWLNHQTRRYWKEWLIEQRRNSLTWA